MSRVIDSLENLNDVKYPSSDTCLHAYLHFEALCDNTYNFSCASCGDHPPVVIMDLHKKGVFSMAGNFCKYDILDKYLNHSVHIFFIFHCVSYNE